MSNSTTTESLATSSSSIASSTSTSTSSSISSTSTMSTSSIPSSTTDPASSVTSVSSSTESISSTTPLTTSSSSIDTSSLLSSISSEVSSSILSPSSTTTVEPSSTEPRSTTTLSLSSQPATTRVYTSVVTPTDGQSASQVTIVVTQTQAATSVPITSAVSADVSTTSSAGATLNTGSSGGSGGGGLSTAGTTAVAVVVPVAVVALLVVAGIFFWRKRKQRKAAEEARRKEVEDYGFNPNNDPTLPAVASESGQAMSEDHSSGYRGWGAAGASNRKMSTTLSGGHTQGQLSDTGSNPYRGGVSPTGANSDGHSGDALMQQRRETMNSDDVGSLGQAPLASTNQPGMKRGPSNASSTYSAAGHSDVSDGPPPPGGMASSYEAYNPNSGFGYSQHGPYGDGTYGGGNGAEGGMPIVRDVSARRNTRIQQPGNYQQGNSGIAQNF